MFSSITPYQQILGVAAASGALALVGPEITEKAIQAIHAPVNRAIDVLPWRLKEKLPYCLKGTPSNNKDLSDHQTLQGYSVKTLGLRVGYLSTGVMTALLAAGLTVALLKPSGVPLRKKAFSAAGVSGAFSLLGPEITKIALRTLLNWGSSGKQPLLAGSSNKNTGGHKRISERKLELIGERVRYLSMGVTASLLIGLFTASLLKPSA